MTATTPPTEPPTEQEEPPPPRGPLASTPPATATRPQRALFALLAEQRRFVYLAVALLSAAGVAHARPVAVGARTAQAVEITRGLTAGERVVTYGAYGVEDSAKVVPAAGDGAAP